MPKQTAAQKRKRVLERGKRADELRVKFIEAYLANGGNATQAAMAAEHGSTYYRAKLSGMRLLRRADIVEEIKARRMALRKRVGYGPEEATDRLVELMDYDPRDACDENGMILPLHMLPDSITRVISGYEITRFGPKLTFPNRLDALDKLLRHLGQYEKDNRQKVNALGEFLEKYWLKKPGLIAEIDERAKMLAAPIEGEAERVVNEDGGQPMGG